MNIHEAFDTWMKKKFPNKKQMHGSSQFTWEDIKEAFMQGESVGFSNGRHAATLWNAPPIPARKL